MISMDYDDEYIFDQDDLSVVESLDLVTFRNDDSVAGHVDSLAEVFTEYYLFDSSCEKSIEQFLKSEKLDDIFTESEFMDLICGGAYLTDDLVHFIVLKLPFRITADRLIFLNNLAKKKNRSAYLIKKDIDSDKVQKALDDKQEIKRKKRCEYSRKWRSEHPEYREDPEKHRERLRKYRSEHPEVAKAYREKNKERIKVQRKKYYKLNKKYIQERNKKWVKEHSERYKEYQAQWRREHAEEQKQYHKEYREKNAAKVSARKKKCYKAKKLQYQKQHKEYYEAHKDECRLKNEEARQKRKERASAAQSVCALYLYLLYLKKNNRAKYLEFYTYQQDPISNLIKTCAALQNMDLKKCPFFDNDVADEKVQQQCASRAVFNVPGAVPEIQKYIEQLKQNAR